MAQVERTGARNEKYFNELVIIGTYPFFTFFCVTESRL